MKRGWFVALVAATGIAASPRTSWAEPFVAGQVLRVTFDLSGIDGSPVVHAPGGQVFTMPRDADVFGVSVLVNSGTGVNNFNVRLFDGDRLLGTATAPAAPVINGPFADWASFYFQSTSALRQPFMSPQGYLVEPTIIDFSPLLAGSIDGIVEFTMDAGAIDRQKRFGVALFLGRAVDARDAYGVQIFPHGESPIPEPATLLMMGAGAMAAWARGRRIGRRPRPATARASA
jgi:hypothetical protein